VYVNASNIYVNPEEIGDEQQVAKKFSEILGGDESEYKNLIRKRDLRYIPIINKISLSSSEKITKYIDEEKQALKQGILEQTDTIG